MMPKVTTCISNGLHTEILHKFVQIHVAAPTGGTVQFPKIQFSAFDQLQINL